MRMDPPGVDMVTHRRGKGSRSQKIKKEDSDDDFYNVDEDINGDIVMDSTFDDIAQIKINDKNSHHRRKSMEEDEKWERMLNGQQQKERALKQIAKEKEQEISAKPNSNSTKMAMILECFKNRKMQLRDAFRKDTVLDAMKNCDVKNEPLQDMALALDSATMVYGYRVDSAHADMYDTRCVFQQGKDGRSALVNQDIQDRINERNRHLKEEEEQPTASDEIPQDQDDHEEEEVPKKKRKKDVPIGDEASRHMRMAQLLEQVGGEGDEIDESDDDDELRRDPTAPQAYRQCDWHYKDNMVTRLEEDVRQRKDEMNRHNGGGNPKLVTDSSTLHLKRKEHRENPYFAKVLYNVNRKRNGGLFTFNAETSQDCRRMVLHPRANEPNPEDDYSTPYSKDFLQSIAGLCDWALQKYPEPFHRSLLPTTSISNKNRGIVMGGLGNLNEDEEYDLEEDEIEEDVITNQREEDDTILPDRTIMDGTVMANQTLAFSGKLKDRRRVTLKGLGEKQIRMPDKLEPVRQIAMKTEADIAMGLGSLLMKKVESEKPYSSGIDAEEFHLVTTERNDNEDMHKETADCACVGLGNFVRSFENSWHCTLAKVTVTREAEQIALRKAREDAGEDKSKRRRLEELVLKPGKYKFFVAPPEYPRNYPPDPSASSHTLAGVMVDLPSSDAQEQNQSMQNGNADWDDDIGVMDDMGYIEPKDLVNDEINRAEQAAMEEQANLDILLDKGQKTEEVREFPRDDGDEARELVAPEMIIDPDMALRRLGKEDDAHWKFGKEDDKLKKGAKKKKEDTAGPKDDEHYFSVTSEEERRNYRKRFELVPMNERHTLQQTSDKIFLKHRKTMRKTQLVYDFENFVKPGILFKGRYGTVRFERNTQMNTHHSHVIEKQFQGILRSNRERENEEEDEDSEDAYFDFLRTFANYKFELNSDADRSVLTGGMADRTFDLYQSEHLGSPEEEPPQEINIDIGDDDFDDCGNVEMEMDSWHSAPAVPYQEKEVDESTLTPRQIQKRKRDRQIRERRLQEDEDVPIYDLTQTGSCDKALLEEMLELAKRAKQQRVDTLQVKVAMKGLLSNKFLDDRHLLVVNREDDRPSTSSDKENLSDTEKSICTPDCSSASSPMEIEDDAEVTETEIARALNAPPVDLDDEDVEEILGSDEGELGPEALNSSLRVTDFEVAGEHSFASVVSCLPHRLPPQDANVHVATALVIALHMCNENSLICSQNRPDDFDDVQSADWMRNFVFCNGKRD